MFRLALKTVPPPSVVSSQESEEVMQRLQTVRNSIALREWEHKLAIGNEKLSRFRKVADGTRSEEEEIEYQQLLKQMAWDYIRSKIEMQPCEFGLPPAAQFYADERRYNGESYTHSIEQVMMFILHGDLSLSQIDKYITELIEKRIGSVECQ